MQISNVRRQVYRLSSQEISEYPVWEFCSDEEDREGQDEATVRPSIETEVSGYSPGGYVISADVTFANGTSAIGYLYSGKPDDWGCIQPNLITDSGQINLWLGAMQFIANPDDEIQKRYLALKSNADQVFPISFRSRAKVNGSLMQVSVEGFMAKTREGEIAIIR
jgi:hypothetical protein